MRKRLLAIILAAATAIGMAAVPAASSSTSATITVTDSKQDAAVQNVSLNPSSKTIAVDGTFTITATIGVSATVGASDDAITVSAVSGSTDVVQITGVTNKGDASLGASTLSTKNFTVDVACKGLKPGTSAITVSTSKQEGSGRTAAVTSAACNVTVEKTFSTLSLDLSSIAPAAGGTPATTVTGLPAGTSLSGNLSWKVKDGSALAAGAKFEAGKQYQAEMTLAPSQYHKFGDSVNVTVTNPSGATATGAKNSSNLKVTVTFPATPAAANQTISGAQTVGITAPAAGAAPQTSITPPANTTISEVNWTDKDGATVGASFQNGKQYKVSFKLNAATGYEFANDATVSVPGAQPSVTRTSAQQLSVTATFPTVGNTDSKPSISATSVRYDRRTGGDIVLTVTNGTGEFELSSNITVKNGSAALVRDTDFRYEPIAGSNNQRLTLLDSYLRTLSAGSARLDVAISPAGGATVGANWAISVDVYTSSNPSTGNTTAGGSDDDDDDENYGRADGSSNVSGDTTVSPKAKETSSNVSPLTGAVKETTAVKDVEKALENASASDTNVNVTVRNAKSISTKTLNSMADVIGESEKAVVLHADKVQNGKVISRLYIDIKKAAKLGKDVSLDVSVGDKQVEKLFNKYYTNDVSVVSFGQKGGFGMEIDVAVKVDLSKFNPENLMFYNYSSQKNSYMRITPKFFIDRNGYLHFKTMNGGSMIITDSALKKK